MQLKETKIGDRVTISPIELRRSGYTTTKPLKGTIVRQSYSLAYLAWDPIEITTDINYVTASSNAAFPKLTKEISLYDYTECTISKKNTPSNSAGFLLACIGAGIGISHLTQIKNTSASTNKFLTDLQ
jgi:hypothetical protein